MEGRQNETSWWCVAAVLLYYLQRMELNVFNEIILWLLFYLAFLVIHVAVKCSFFVFFYCKLNVKVKLRTISFVLIALHVSAFHSTAWKPTAAEDGKKFRYFNSGWHCHLPLPLPSFSASLIKFYRPALIHFNDIRFAVYRLPGSRWMKHQSAMVLL